MENSKLQDYFFISKLGEGSFGSVYKVRHRPDGQLYALKVVNTSRMSKTHQKEALQESTLLASLSNPFIVKYYHSFIESKILYIVMEFCNKGDLNKLIKLQKSLLPEPTIWKYFIQMSLGLEYLHSKNTLHRDLKSMNIFIGDTLKIGDLGVAKILSSSGGFANTKVGTPIYLSPELCQEKPYNNKSDIWALGCLVYELCTLKHPFMAPNEAALVMKIVKGEFRAISSCYSVELEGLVRVLLKKNFKERPDIESVLKGYNIKEKAERLGIFIPETSVLFGQTVKRNKIIENKREIFLNEVSVRQIRPETGVKKEVKPSIISRYKEIKPVNPITYPEKKPVVKRGKSVLRSDLEEEVFSVRNLPEIPLIKRPTSTVKITPVFTTEEIQKEIEYWKLACNIEEVTEYPLLEKPIIQLEFEHDELSEANKIFQSLKDKQTAFQESISKIKQEILEKISELIFSDLYNYVNLKLQQEDLNWSDQEEISNYVSEHLPNFPEIIFDLYHLLHLEAELGNLENSISLLRYEFLSLSEYKSSFNFIISKNKFFRIEIVNDLEMNPFEFEIPSLNPNDPFLSEHISQLLQEPNQALLRAIQNYIGGEYLLELLYEVKRIQDFGGVVNVHETRYRTPGGILFSLVKKNLPLEHSKILFGPFDKIKKAEYKKLKKN